jgi:hypothetical protein
MNNRNISVDIAERELTVIVSLNNHVVRYLIVGGYAMLFHGDEERLVNDLDIWIDNESDNSYRCFKALQAIMPGSLRFQPHCLSEKGRKIDLRGNYYDVEIFTSMEGTEFDLCFSRHETLIQGSESLYFIGARDLLQIKKTAYASYLERIEKEERDITFLEAIIRA